MTAARLTNLELASAFSDLRRLRPASRDNRYLSTAVKVHPPKKEMSEYRRGLRTPGSIVSYRIGRALENVFKEKHLDAERAELSKLGVEVLPDTINGACCGLDALIVAGCWADAIACVGMFVGKKEEVRWGLADHLGNTLRRELHDETLPPGFYPGLDEAWVKWTTNPTLEDLPPRFAAAYLLAKSPEPRNKKTAAEILEEWRPQHYTIGN
jgi:hypothetical protein